MKAIDVFNGDADGICALHQWRLAYPVETTLVTGVKRDIQLLQSVKVGAGDTATGESDGQRACAEEQAGWRR